MGEKDRDVFQFRLDDDIKKDLKICMDYMQKEHNIKSKSGAIREALHRFAKDIKENKV